jgi:hypothetical protein
VLLVMAISLLSMPDRSCMCAVSCSASPQEHIGNGIEAIPTGLHCSNYKAEGEAIIHAAHTIKCTVDNNTRVVFLTDALSITSCDEWQPTSAWTGVIPWYCLWLLLSIGILNAYTSPSFRCSVCGWSICMHSYPD